MHIFYKPSPELYIVDWLPHNNRIENRDQEITGMNVNIYIFSMAVDILICTSIEHIRASSSQEPANAENVHNQRLAAN